MTTQTTEDTTLTLCDVFGTSDWPKDRGQEFAIFSARPFVSEKDAVTAAQAAYSESLEVRVQIVDPTAESPVA